MTKQTDGPGSGRALRPSNDTSRIAATLRALTEARGTHPLPARDTPTVLSAAAVEAVIQARALRSSFIAPELLGDPAWDMLLELLHGEITDRPITAPILAKAGGVYPAAGRRWIGVLADKGLCTRPSADLKHGTIRLSQAGSNAMRAYFAKLTERPFNLDV